MKKLCVIFGGLSCEHDISIITAMQLKKNILKPIEMLYLGLDNKFYLATEAESVSDFKNKRTLKFKQVVLYDGAVYKKGLTFKKLFDIDCVINCCHGGVGENGDLSGFFAVNKIRHTSSKSLPAHVAMDKNLCKQCVSEIVPTIKGNLVKKSNFNEKIMEIDKNFADFLIIKPNSLGSSIGVMACDKQNFKHQISAIFELGDDALVEERVVDIVEYNQACFKDGESLVLSAIESPKTKSDFLTFEDKYKSEGKTKGFDRELPAKIGKNLQSQIGEYTKKIYSQLNLDGVVRIDYIFDKKTGVLYFNEVNTVPGSLAFYLFEPLGIDYQTLIDKIVASSSVDKTFKYFETDILNFKKL